MLLSITSFYSVHCQSTNIFWKAKLSALQLRRKTFSVSFMPVTGDPDQARGGRVQGAWFFSRTLLHHCDETIVRFTNFHCQSYVYIRMCNIAAKIEQSTACALLHCLWLSCSNHIHSALNKPLSWAKRVCKNRSENIPLAWDCDLLVWSYYICLRMVTQTV